MELKVGTKVLIKKGLFKNYEGEVHTILPGDWYEVYIDKLFKSIMLDSNDFEVIPDLPRGAQLELDLVYPETKCSCGGYKVFGTMSQEAHSSWCDVFSITK